VPHADLQPRPVAASGNNRDGPGRRAADNPEPFCDAYGAWIWNEGRPTDIPRLEGTRVVVIDPPPYERMWNAGRAYPLMRHSVTVDEILPSTEAARWLSMMKRPSR
jgi:hypothetical protein